MSRSVADCLTPPPSPGREPETRKKEPIRLPYKSIVTVEDCTDDEGDDYFRGYRAPSVEAVQDQDLPKKQAKPAAQKPAAAAPSVSFAPTPIQRRRSASPETSRSSSPKRVHFSDRPHSVRRRSDRPPPVFIPLKTEQQASAPRVPTPYPWDNSRRLDSLLYQLSSYIVDAYEPRTSIDAIPPVKMTKFFQDFPIAGRDHIVVPGPSSPSVFPFKRPARHVDLHTIFMREPGAAHYSALSAFYANLNCEVVMMPKERGNNRLGQQMVPSLTPAGFVSFMKLMIRAFPEREARRWSLVESVLDRDGRRLYARELFPTRKHEPSRRELEDAVDEWASVAQSVQKREERGRGSSRGEGKRRRDEKDSRPRRR